MAYEVERHEQRAAIDALLREGKLSYASIGGMFNLSESSVRRYAHFARGAGWLPPRPRRRERPSEHEQRIQETVDQGYPRDRAEVFVAEMAVVRARWPKGLDQEGYDAIHAALARLDGMTLEAWRREHEMPAQLPPREAAS